MSAARNISRFIRKLVGNTRRLEAAGSGRAAGITSAGPMNPEVMAQGSVVRARARGSFYNNGLIDRAV